MAEKGRPDRRMGWSSQTVCSWPRAPPSFYSARATYATSGGSRRRIQEWYGFIFCAPRPTPDIHASNSPNSLKLIGKHLGLYSWPIFFAIHMYIVALDPKNHPLNYPVASVASKPHMHTVLRTYLHREYHSQSIGNGTAAIQVRKVSQLITSTSYCC